MLFHRNDSTLENGLEVTECRDLSILFAFTSTLKKWAVPVMGSIGLLGNSIALLSIKYFKSQTTFHQSLMALCIADVVFITVILIDQSYDISTDLAILFPYFWHPMRTILISVEAFLIMSISTERFVAVKWPLNYKASCISQCRKIHFSVFILPVLVSAIALNIPKFMELEFFESELENGNLTVGVADLRLDENYIFYYIHCTRLITTGVVPIIYMIIVNILIFKMIKEQQNRRRQSVVLMMSDDACATSAAGLFALVILFIVCNVPRLALNHWEWNIVQKIEAANICDIEEDLAYLSLLIVVSHLSLVFNSSANVFIYYCIRRIAKCMKKIFSGFWFCRPHTSSHDPDEILLADI